MTYEEALAWVQGKLKFGIKPGLERMQWLLSELGNPQEKIKAVHIVGTNGKGSTVSYLQHIFSEAGYEVGTFTSPYLIDFRERISLNGHMISKGDFCTLVDLVMPVVERLPLETELEAATEFEVITLLMLTYFGLLHPVDIAFIEAGLGGLHDSTNVLTPLAVVCPSIGLDHQNILGDTYEAIAKEKVGVLKSGVPLIFSSKRPDVTSVFRKKAAQTGSTLYQLGEAFQVSLSANSFSFNYQTEQFSNIELSMIGKHQMENASLALMTALLLKEVYPRLNNRQIQTALEHSVWAGRTEFITPNLMIDGAHNRESVSVLVDVLERYAKNKEVHILFAAIDTKPVEDMLEQLATFDSLTVTTFPYPNSLPLESYPSQYRKIESIMAWLDKIDLSSKEKLYVITGSLYFIAQVRKTLLKSLKK
ncbi:bifunctional folylpolyglutamate synthase/dihydrofolate synthase [Streptococcus sp.]|nr:folylpolyglutamate synthase/dihydrofolate synthase family protein [Streptococcus sp.]